MDQMFDAAVQQARKRLRAARELAWEAFDAPSEETVMTIYREICAAIDAVAVGPDMAEGSGAVVH